MKRTASVTRGSARERLARAWAARAPLREEGGTDCFRVAHGGADGVPGITVDHFSGVVVLSLYEAFDEEEEAAWIVAAAEVCGARAVYLKRRPREARIVATTRRDELAPEPPAWGAPVPELVTQEGGLKFRILPGQGLSVGLYLDMRATRAWLRSQVEAKSVLNCFAYTCAFGVVAVAGGARRAVNVDLSRRVLDWGADNARLNGQSPQRADYLSGDVFDWLGRFGKRAEQFDVVVLDPPSFAKGELGTFSAASDYGSLAALAAPLVAPGGLLVACCNLARLTPSRFEAMVRAGVTQAGREVHSAGWLAASTLDFPSLPGEPGALKVMATRFHAAGGKKG